MKNALNFLSEWAEGEAWKTHVLKEVTTNSVIDTSRLLAEVIYLLSNQDQQETAVTTEMEPINDTVLVINEIKSPRNINALSNDVHFSLGKNLNVFYGENGSGKSSYIRMFRKLADNYFTDEKNLSIIPNVYDESATTGDYSQTVDVRYSVNGTETYETIDINEPHPILSRLNVFDNDSVIPLINSDLSFSVLPKGFEVFQKVSEQLDALRKETSQIIEREKMKQNELFADSSFDSLRNDLDRIKQEVSCSRKLKTYLDTHYPRADKYDEAISALEKKIRELESSNPSDKVKILSAQKTKLESIRRSTEQLSVALSAENISKINQLIGDYELKIQEERIFNEDFRRNIAFLDVVSDEWFAFIHAGKRYYDSVHISQVEEGTPCIFCGHPYDSGSVKLVGSYFWHVSNSTKYAQDSIEKELLRHDLTGVVISLADDELALFENEKFIERLKASIQLISRNKELFTDHIRKKSLVPDAAVLDVTGLTQEITNEISLLTERIDNLGKNEVEIGEIIASHKASKIEVERNEKLHASIPLLEKWIGLNDMIAEHTKASRKFSTNSLTQKQGEAFREIIQSTYIETFNRFAQDLRVANVNIKLNSQKGQTVRRKYVVSEEYKVSNVMSEGEQKAISLVEFATDLTMRRNLNSVLFDDPVTSLDYKRSELIANLIYELSLERPGRYSPR